MKKILVTGAFGQIGSELVPTLWKKYGKENVIAGGHKNIPENFDGMVETADVTDVSQIKSLIEKYQITDIFHLSGLLSVASENDPETAWEVNLGGLKNILDLSKKHNIKLFWPSSIAAFGPTTPRDNTPQHTIMEPTTIYGVTKVAGENLCHYYNVRYNVDVRSLRYPGIISWKTPPSQGTTEYTVAMFYDAVQNKANVCWLKPETMLPMMYIDDAISATLTLMEGDMSKITIRTSYNVAAISFEAKDLEAEIKKHLPDLKVTYNPDERQKIADSWPKSIDDSQARKDWGWKHEYDLSKMSEEIIKNLKIKFNISR